ncbi:MAG TPA: DciA family protein [Alphaproteobacteria bacterium]|nr:DciA family protein [Alphaproteobacteria bacterium]
MRPIFEATARVSGQSFSRKYVSLGRILSSWKEIVGEKLAGKAQPVKINYRKREKGGNPVAILDIAASSADSTLLHYQKDLILERINQIFGDKWVTAIRFVATPVSIKGKTAKKSRISLTEDEKSHLSGMLESLADPDLKAKLETLGTAIITEQKQ